MLEPYIVQHNWPIHQVRPNWSGFVLMHFIVKKGSECYESSSDEEAMFDATIDINSRNRCYGRDVSSRFSRWTFNSVLTQVTQVTQVRAKSTQYNRSGVNFTQRRVPSGLFRKYMFITGFDYNNCTSLKLLPEPAHHLNTYQSSLFCELNI